MSDCERCKLLEAKIAKLEAKVRPSPTSGVFDAYCDAMESRYGARPDNSPKIRGQMAQLLKLVPGAEAEDLVRYYVSHTDAFYTRAQHDFGLCLKDAHRLRMEMKTGKSVTTQQARVGESQGATRAAISDYYREKHGRKDT